MTRHAPKIPLPGLREVEPDELLVIAGETASGKTDFTLRIARSLASNGGEGGGVIVGADSVQVYRGFDIGSGKPTKDELGDVPHALLDVADPDEPFDAARFVTMAEQAIARAREEGRTPIVCGGTFLWIKALVWGLAEAPSPPKELRDALNEEATRLGSPAMHARLQQIDPTTAARLHPNDALRIVRALEVHAMTGRPLSQLHAEHGFRSTRHRARIVAIRHARADLEARIARRVDAMLTRGWIDEVKTLVAKGYGQTRPMQSVGYAEVKDFVDGATNIEASATRDDLALRIVRATKTFARRQRTWLKSAPVEWIDQSLAASG
jgi:tRNA dimethylallyltransferase